MSRENVELVRAAFGLVIIPGDPAAMIAASEPGVEMHLVGVGGEPVHYAGPSGIRDFFRRGYAAVSTPEIGRSCRRLPTAGLEGVLRAPRGRQG
jgi:hypothetical protein